MSPQQKSLIKARKLKYLFVVVTLGFFPHFTLNFSCSCLFI